MVLPLLTIGGAATGLLGGILGGASQAAQARAQNRAAQKQAEAQYKRAQQEYAIDGAARLAQWEWDKARIEQLRFNERQAKLDYNDYNSKLIAAAERNLSINQGALYDKFVSEEALRGTQVGLEYRQTTNKLADDSSELLRQYLVGINVAAQQSSNAVSKLTTDSQELLSSLVMDAERDELGWQINQLQGVMRDAEAKGVAITRQGGGATAQRLAMDSAKALGRTYGELTLRTRDRQSKLALLNRTMSSNAANEMAANAIQLQDSAEKMAYANKRYASDYDTTKQQMQKLTIPSFSLANRQYQRELNALQLQTQQVFDQAARPYREQQYLNPLEPIMGLKPELVAPTKVAGPGALSTIGSSILAGFSGAMQGAVPMASGGFRFT